MKQKYVSIGGIVHRVKNKEALAVAGQTICSIPFSFAKKPWPNLRIRRAKTSNKPIDCMACIAAEAS